MEGRYPGVCVFVCSFDPVHVVVLHQSGTSGTCSCTAPSLNTCSGGGRFHASTGNIAGTKASFGSTNTIRYEVGIRREEH